MTLTLVHTEEQAPAFEVWDPSRHLTAYQSYGQFVKPELLGAGLVIPGKAIGFIDGIGHTKSVYIYGLRANPQLPAVSRMKATMALVEAGIRAAKEAGYSYGVLSTSNPSILGLFSKRLGFTVTGDSMMEGEL